MDPFGPLSLPELPLEIVQGETFILPITYTDENENLVNFQGYTAKMQIRPSVNATGTAVLELSTENDGISVDGANGYLEIFIPSTITATLPADFEGVYDLFIYGTTGISIRLLRGPVLISGRVTK